MTAELENPLVLLVDDHRAVCELFTSFLERNDYRVVTAVTGEEGYDVAIRDRPDAVITDIMMPDGDGWWLLGSIRRNFVLRDAPVVFFSGEAETRHWLEDLGVAPDGFIAKDPDLNTLREALDKLTEPVRELKKNPGSTRSGEVHGLGVVPLLRACAATSDAGGRVSLTAPGPRSATVELFEGTLVSARYLGEQRADGAEALELLIGRQWERYRFAQKSDDSGAPGLGPVEDLISAACAGNQRTFTEIKEHGLHEGGGFATRETVLAQYRKDCGTEAAAVVAAILEAKKIEEIVATSSFPLEKVHHVLFDMMCQGVFVRGAEAGRDKAAAPRRTISRPLSVPKLSGIPKLGTLAPPALKPPVAKPAAPGEAKAKAPPEPPPTPEPEAKAPPEPPPTPEPEAKAPPEPPPTSEPEAQAPPESPLTPEPEAQAPPEPPPASEPEAKAPPEPPAASEVEAKAPPEPPAAPEVEAKAPPEPPPPEPEPLSPDDLEVELVPEPESAREPEPRPAPEPELKGPPEPPPPEPEPPVEPATPLEPEPADQLADLSAVKPEVVATEEEEEPPVLDDDSALVRPTRRSWGLYAGVAGTVVLAAAAGAYFVFFGGDILGVEILGSGSSAEATAEADTGDPELVAEAIPEEEEELVETPEGESEEPAPEEEEEEAEEPAPEEEEEEPPAAEEAEEAEEEEVLASEPEPASGRKKKGPKKKRAGRKKKEKAPKAVDTAAAGRHLGAGNRFLLTGKNAAAIRELRAAVKADPGFADAYKSLAIAYANSGKKGPATKALKKYVALKPGAPGATHIRSRIAAME